HEGAMPVVRPRLPRRRVEPALPCPLADLGIGDVVLQRRLLLGLGILRPDALRPPEVGNAGVRRDAGARERHHAPGLLDPAANEIDQRASSFATASSTTVPLKKSGFRAVCRRAAKSSICSRYSRAVISSSVLNGGTRLRQLMSSSSLSS